MPFALMNKFEDEAQADGSWASPPGLPPGLLDPSRGQNASQNYGVSRDIEAAAWLGDDRRGGAARKGGCRGVDLQDQEAIHQAGVIGLMDAWEESEQRPARPISKSNKIQSQGPSGWHSDYHGQGGHAPPWSGEHNAMWWQHGRNEKEAYELGGRQQKSYTGFPNAVLGNPVHVPVPTWSQGESLFHDGMGLAPREERQAEGWDPNCPQALQRLPAPRAPPGRFEDGQCRWHKSAETVGVISHDGHVFTKAAGPRRSRVSNRGEQVELGSLCMVFDASLRHGGVHRYCYEIMDGKLGPADGAGFVFDSKVRRNNIQRMRSVFLNQRGYICLRNHQHVTNLQVQLAPLTVGTTLHLVVDLDSLVARFNVSNAQGTIDGSADVSLEGLFEYGKGGGHLRSGFFCAVVTSSIAVRLH